MQNCPKDCQAKPPGFCGDGQCDYDESPEGCPKDCGPKGWVCNNNGMCESYMGEGPECPDCGQAPRMCNDNGVCEGGEPGYCPDCQQMKQECNYNNKCEEDMSEGPWCRDCGGASGCFNNGKCDPGEPGYCKDCSAMFCGDKNCGPGEDPYNCPADCMTGEKKCNMNGFCDRDEGPWCEDCTKMKFCGDGRCDGTENPYNCPQDCGAKGWCGDGRCDDMSGESERTCPQDCKQSAKCGDKVCGPNENPQNCPRDCMAAKCNNGMCEPGEMESCPQDCKIEKYCGDGICEDYEKEFCFADCEVQAECGDNICDYGEWESCYIDCKVEEYCGDGFCGETEDHEMCPIDCVSAGFCGNGVCEDAEDLKCPEDCGIDSVCGDGFCGFNENPGNCQEDCTFREFFMDFETDRFFYQPGDTVGIIARVKDNEGNFIEDATVRANVFYMGEFKVKETRIIKMERTVETSKTVAKTVATATGTVTTTEEVSESNPQPSPGPQTVASTAATTTTSLTSATGQQVAAMGGGGGGGYVSESNPQPSPGPAMGGGGGYGMPGQGGQMGPGMGPDMYGQMGPGMGPDMYGQMGPGQGGQMGPGMGPDMYGQMGPGQGGQMGPGMGPDMYGQMGPGVGPDMYGQMGPKMIGGMGPMGPCNFNGICEEQYGEGPDCRPDCNPYGQDDKMAGPIMMEGMGPMSIPPEIMNQMGKTITTRDGRVIKVAMQGACQNGRCCPDDVCDVGEMMSGGCPDDCKEVPGWNPSRGFGTTSGAQMGPPGQGGFRGFENYRPGGGSGMGQNMMPQQMAGEMIRYEQQGPRPEEFEDWKGDIYKKFPIALEWDAEKEAYIGKFDLAEDAGSGQYEVEIFALVEDRRMQHRMQFTVSTEGEETKDPFAFEQKAKSAAMRGEYQNCVNDYTHAAEIWVEQQHAQRVIVDVEKASMCVVLGGLDRQEPYTKISEIVEEMAKKRGGAEKYIMMGTAAQYAELAGRHDDAKSMYKRGIKGLEREAEFVAEENPQGGVMLRMILGKYYEMVGRSEDAKRVYIEVAEGIEDAFGEYGGPPEFIQTMIAAKLYEIAGDFEEAKFKYEEAADLVEFEEAIPGDAYGAVTAFMQGYCLEKAGDKERADEKYAEAADLLDDLEMMDSEGIFFGSSAVGKSQERLGDTEAANKVFVAALKNLERRSDKEGYYFASGLAGYTGDFEKAKLYCKKELLRNLDADDIERMTFYSAYCYDVLGAGRKARAACNLAQTMPDAGESIMMRFVFEPFPTPASFCSKTLAVEPMTKLESCGNDAVDPGETEDTCCLDVGCGSGYVCSKALNRCVLPAKEIEPEKILSLLLELEDIRMKFDSLASKALGISEFFDGKGNAERAEIWAGVADEFLGAGDKIDDIQRKIKDNRDALTEDVLEDVRGDIRGLREVIKNAIDLILEAI